MENPKFIGTNLWKKISDRDRKEKEKGIKKNWRYQLILTALPHHFHVAEELLHYSLQMREGKVVIYVLKLDITL